MAKLAITFLDSNYETYMFYSEKEDYSLNFQRFDEITIIDKLSL